MSTASERNKVLVLAFTFGLVVGAVATEPAQAGETVLHSFNPYPQGAYPQTGVSLCTGPGRMLFGTAYGGGSSGGGTVYRLDSTNHETTLYSFSGGADGGGLVADVICGSDGHIYGTTLFGGSAGAGVVYRVEATGHETVLYNFTGGADGGYPFAGVIQDPAGNLDGTTNGGGQYGAGTVFRLDTKGNETVLYSFTGGNDGAFPYGNLIRDAGGNLYGTTCCGGSGGAGNVFKLSPSGQETVLYNFTGGADGGFPSTGVVFDSAGNLYGTTGSGGQYGAGVVYKLSAAGQESVLYSFTGGNDGGYPSSGVVLDGAGNLYGTTPYGGANFVGVVYKIDPSGHETVLYTFTGKTDGGYPAGLVTDSAGNLYGATNGGGGAGGGLVFKMDTAGHETVLYSFPGVDGGGPAASVIEDAAGNFYGTTYGGGPAGVGVIYKLDTKGRETILYSFTGGLDGANPSSGLIMDAAGDVYGTAFSGGSAGAGVVFKLDPTGHETVLYSFTGQCCGVPTTDGAVPSGGVIVDSAGNLYGTTRYGGSTGWGTVYKLDPTGQETILYNFAGAPDGALPEAGVTRDSAGNLYGTTVLGGHDIYGFQGGVAYKLDPSGNETVLYNFCSQLNCADGVDLFGGLTLDAAGNLYGNAWSGGPPIGDFPGVVYKLDPSGHETVVYAFTGFSDGGGPIGNPLLDSAGNLYGVTQFGGQGPCPFFGCGVVFKVDPTGHETVLYSFTGFSDGSEPTAGVIRGPAGNLYGTTSIGGAAGAGVVYKIGSGSTTLPPPRHAPPLFQLPAKANRPAPPCVLPFPQQRMECPSSLSRQLQPATQ